MKNIFILLLVFVGVQIIAQETKQETSPIYKKRILENTELDLLSSYYTQDGDNASVTGGRGTEELTNTVGKINLAIPIGDDDILTINTGISAYTSASSSQLNPFDGNGPADPFVSTTGASKADELISLYTSYTHHSNNRNNIWSLNASLSTEHDYSSIGLGGSYTHAFNEKNTEVSLKANVFLDNWSVLYPYELGGPGGDSETGEFVPFNPSQYTITGNTNYQPHFTPFNDTKRNSYTFGVGLSQILSKKIQALVSLDLTQQQGLLANHMQRVYFKDVEDSFVDRFHLAEDIERLPDSRFKTALGLKLNYYINELLCLRTFYRFYTDNWGIASHTMQIELPFKISNSLTLYPSYRFYNQTAADYFASYNMHLSTDQYYTSDYDLSKYNANQYGIGMSYTDVFTKFHIGRFRFKSIDFNYHQYKRNTGLSAGIFTGGIKFIIDHKRTK